MLPQSKKVLAVVAALMSIVTVSQVFGQGGTPPPSPAILVFSKTVAFRHASIADGIAAIQKLGQENNFLVDTTTDASFFRDDKLAGYAAVVFLSTTGNVLNSQEQAAFERYMNNGGGFAGIHAAADTEYDWPWYNRLLGAYFLNHPAPQTAEIIVTDKNHPSTTALPDRWQRFDEWYNFQSIVPGIRVLATLDESTYQGGIHGDNHPIIWYQTLGCGRSWYTALGHTAESYRETLFLQHLLGGLQYAMGNGQGCAALPVVFQNFTARPNHQGEVTLNWQTASEHNSDYFLIERSADRLFFGQTARVEAKGRPSSYAFTDKTPGDGLHYYRVRQVDKNGAFQFSHTVSVSLSNGRRVLLFPNPSRGVVQVSTGATAGESIDVRVLNFAGKTVYHKRQAGTRFRLDLSALPAGLYLLEVGGERQQFVLFK